METRKQQVDMETRRLQEEEKTREETEFLVRKIIKYLPKKSDQVRTNIRTLVKNLSKKSFNNSLKKLKKEVKDDITPARFRELASISMERTFSSDHVRSGEESRKTHFDQVLSVFLSLKSSVVKKIGE